ncbi:MAG TPA: hypothetical protein VGN13_01965 [Solirubrobacteraceae bacterium]|jgi:hypothetical protein
MPCRGSGQVISNLGGTPANLTCPWCAGAGVRVPDIDAQARWRDDHPAGASDDDAGAERAADGGEGDDDHPAAAPGEAPAEPSSAS